MMSKYLEKRTRGQGVCVNVYEIVNVPPSSSHPLRTFIASQVFR